MWHWNDFRSFSVKPTSVSFHSLDPTSSQCNALSKPSPWQQAADIKREKLPQPLWITIRSLCRLQTTIDVLIAVCERSLRGAEQHEKWRIRLTWDIYICVICVYRVSCHLDDKESFSTDPRERNLCSVSAELFLNEANILPVWFLVWSLSAFTDCMAL